MRPIEVRDQFERPIAPRRRRANDGSSLRDRVVITATVLGVIIFVAVGLPYLKRDLPAEGLPVPVPSTSDHGTDPDRDAVRRWIDSNYHDSHPREIRWWPACTLDELYRRQLSAAKEVSEDDPSMAEFVAQLEQEGPLRVCRLKFRVTSEVGGQVSHDELFVFRGSHVRPIRSTSSEAGAMRKYFPDDRGQP